MVTPSKAQQIQEKINDAIRQHADVIRGHDAVHPDRNVCGGVGGCKLLMAEAESEDELAGVFAYAARENYRIGVNVEVRR